MRPQQNTRIDLRPEMVTIYKIWQGSIMANSSWKPWKRWGWCDIDDVLKLINKTYDTKWEKRELLERFAIENRSLDKSNQSLSLWLLTDGKSGPLTIMPYRIGLLSSLEKPTTKFYVPAGWVKNVLWAMLGHCRSFSVVTSGANAIQTVVAESDDKDPNLSHIVHPSQKK